MDSFEQAAKCLPDVLQSLAMPGPDHADVFLHSVSQSVVETRSALRGSHFAPPQRHSHLTKIEGISVRSISGSRIRQKASHDLRPRFILTLPTDLNDKVDHTDLAENQDPHFKVSSQPNSLSTRMEMISEAVLDFALSAHPEVTTARVHVAEIGVRRAVASSTTGPEVKRDDTHRLEVNASISVHGHDFAVVKTRLGDDVDMTELARRIGSELARRVEEWIRLPRLPVPSSSSNLLVVLPPGWGAVWLHEAIGHQLEADVLLPGNGAFTGEFNQMVGPDGVTIVDCPTVAGGRVVQDFDDEGTPTQETVLIDRGRLVGALTDQSSALRYGLPATGNARRGHYAQSPRPRMTNLLLRAGKASATDLKSDVVHGIEVLEIDHAWFQQESLKVFLHVVESNLIRNGKTETRLEPLMLSASPQDMLSSIVGVASDFELETDRGYCVKGGAAIPVGVGQPTVVLAGLSVSPAPES